MLQIGEVNNVVGTLFGAVSGGEKFDQLKNAIDGRFSLTEVVKHSVGHCIKCLQLVLYGQLVFVAQFPDALFGQNRYLLCLFNRLQTAPCNVLGYYHVVPCHSTGNVKELAVVCLQRFCIGSAQGFIGLAQFNGQFDQR